MSRPVASTAHVDARLASLAQNPPGLKACAVAPHAGVVVGAPFVLERRPGWRAGSSSTRHSFCDTPDNDAAHMCAWSGASV